MVRVLELCQPSWDSQMCWLIPFLLVVFFSGVSCIWRLDSFLYINDKLCFCLRKKGDGQSFRTKFCGNTSFLVVLWGLRGTIGYLVRWWLSLMPPAAVGHCLFIVTNLVLYFCIGPSSFAVKVRDSLWWAYFYMLLCILHFSSIKVRFL